MFRVVETREALERLGAAAAAVGRDLSFMEVCGTHTVSAFRSGLHSLMPRNVRLLSGPGCPVCVTSQRDIDLLIAAATVPGVTVCTYGDMLRVTGSRGTLEQARGRGATVRVIYSALDAVRLAATEPTRQVVFVAVGFETTAPATAVAILEAERLGLQNFTVLASHKRVLPAMTALLEAGHVRVDGFLCPGHVAIIVGGEAFRPIVDNFGMPCVIAGFEDLHIAAGVAKLAEMVCDDRADLANLYPQAVTAEGNAHAMELIARVFDWTDAAWRGIGMLPRSGMVMRPAFSAFDAQARFGLVAADVPEPPGCLCGEVITGRATPHDCKLFGKACTPTRAIGPCMVSSEGTCQAWFKYHRAPAAGAPATGAGPVPTLAAPDLGVAGLSLPKANAGHAQGAAGRSPRRAAARNGTARRKERTGR